MACALILVEGGGCQDGGVMFVVVATFCYPFFSSRNTTKEFLFCSYPLGVVDFHFFIKETNGFLMDKKRVASFLSFIFTMLGHTCYTCLPHSNTCLPHSQSHSL